METILYSYKGNVRPYGVLLPAHRSFGASPLLEHSFADVPAVNQPAGACKMTSMCMRCNMQSASVSGRKVPRPLDESFVQFVCIRTVSTIRSNWKNYQSNKPSDALLYYCGTLYVCLPEDEVNTIAKKAGRARRLGRQNDKTARHPPAPRNVIHNSTMNEVHGLRKIVRWHVRSNHMRHTSNTELQQHSNTSK